jgi:predicted outer membrane repeat protein
MDIFMKISKELFVFIVFLVVPLITWMHFSPALAATVTVSNTNDSGVGSLRDAISIAAPGDTIDFSVTVIGTIKLTSGEIVINKSLTISGPGAATLAISGNKASRLFNITDGTVTISGLTLRDGNVPGSNGIGGAILMGDCHPAVNSTLTVNNCIFTNNHIPGTYGAGGAIFGCMCGDLTITNTIFTGNSAGYDGGAIWYISQNGKLIINGSTFSNNAATNGDGGAIEFCPPNEVGPRLFSVTDTTFSNNYAGGNTTWAGGGGGIYICCANNTVTISGSTFSGNTAQGYGGGLYNCCGASATHGASTVTITNSTFSGNTAATWSGGGIMADGPVILDSVTMSGNSSPVRVGGGGGGIYTDAPGFSTLRNTIIANSTSGGNCAGDAVTSLGHNLSSDSTCDFGATGDMNNTNPNLGPLADNGGPTRTHALLYGSPAIDGGDPLEYPPTDQRGVSRPLGLAPDIGAYEYEFSPVMPYEGTLGTIVTISAPGFGTKKGKVLIGGLATKVTNWTDTAITTVITKAPPPGVYDLVLKLKEPKGAVITLPDAFAIMAPNIASVVPSSGVEETVITISGSFFGTKKGKVYLRDKSCKVSSWSMDTITFIVPKKMAPGLYNLTVTNKVDSDTLADGFTIVVP